MIYFLTLVFVFAVAVGVPITLIPVWLIVIGALFLYGLFIRYQRRDSRWIGFFIIAISLIIIASIRLEMVSVNEEIIQSLDGDFVHLSGEVASFPEDREVNQRVVLEDLVINEKEYQSLKIILWADIQREIMVRDKVSFWGVLEVPEDFETDSGRVFEYTKYLSKDDIYFEVRNPRSLEIEGFNGFSLMRSLEKLKTFFISRMQKVLPEPHSSLAGGILLGEKQSLGDIWQDKFREVGLTHIVVLSGYNISIVVEVILYFLSGLSILASSVFGILGIILFALLVGGGATVVRASIMASLLVLARYFKRPYDALRGLFLAGFVMVLINPRILFNDLSFQLSFLATLGIILFMDVALKIFRKVPQKFALQEIVATTFSAQLFVLPWIVYTIGDFSIISFLANILVLPAIPLAMLFSFIAGLIPITVIAFPAYLFLGYALFVTDTLSKVPFASIVIPKVPLFLVALIYILILYLTFRFRR